ncbi:MAG: tRNA pseudouridine synthase A, partial [Candidatus Cloacimonadota bacterium]|nr:tRNA pseudouridine synthase A [Candidatus Cloacimonadota bacterium]
MRRIALRLSYDGTFFNGWQIQKQGRTVQAVLEKALSEICKQEIKIMGSGRTDSGVHALNQIAHLDFPLNFELSRLPIALHTKLPADIRIKQVYAVDDKFHARYDAYERNYRYILTSIRTPFNRYYKTFLPRKKIDIDLIKSALS